MDTDGGPVELPAPTLANLEDIAKVGVTDG